MSNPKLSRATLVTIDRHINGLIEGGHNIYGPMTIAKAVRNGLMSSGSGTVRVWVTVADGEHAGANVVSTDRQYYAAYDPVLQYPSGMPRHDHLGDPLPDAVTA